LSVQSRHACRHWYGETWACRCSGILPDSLVATCYWSSLCGPNALFLEKRARLSFVWTHGHWLLLEPPCWIDRKNICCVPLDIE
jgi:hypothetical protein